MQTRLSTVLEIVSAVAVVISLVFVGWEIRNGNQQPEQNTRALQVSAYQDLIARIVDVNAVGIEESTTIESLVAIESPTDKETDKLNSFLWILFRHGDMACFQFENGSISEDRMLSAMAPLLARLQYPRVAKRWHEVKQVFVPAYASFIDSRLEAAR